jgi:ParB-like chromosome segregation protein Spo0J
MESNFMSEIQYRVRDAILVPIEEIFANDYNPNRMPTVEMELLDSCIARYGFLFPLICTFDKNVQKYRIIDGYHRYESLKRRGATHAEILDLKISYHDAVQLTVLMNRIKGIHQVERMADVVSKLSDLGLEDSEICENLGMEPEEYGRLKQQLGIAHVFRNARYGNAWSGET